MSSTLDQSQQSTSPQADTSQSSPSLHEDKKSAMYHPDNSTSDDRIYLIRFLQSHETFRLPEIEALERLINEKLSGKFARKTHSIKHVGLASLNVERHVRVEVLSYSVDSPYCLVRFHRNDSKDSVQGVLGAPNGTMPPATSSTEEIASTFGSLSISSRGIYEFWGQGASYAELHENIKKTTRHRWKDYEHYSFKFSVDVFCNKRSTAEQREIIESFSYLGFKGKISMRDPHEEFVVFEEWKVHRPKRDAESGDGIDETVDGDVEAARLNDFVIPRSLQRIFLCRKIAVSRRSLVEKHNLKKRPYISTTSMDAELALVTANLALAAPGKLFLDPFVGTGGFMVAAAELGALVLGSDIDGRSFRGKGPGMVKGVAANFRKYGLQSFFGDCLTSDLTNTPFGNSQSARKQRWLDGMVCDPPYGVREGLKVLGQRHAADGSKNEGESESEANGHRSPSTPHMRDGVLAHTLPGYIAPKRPYSFTRMLDDILDFAARTLIDGGRLAFWMPSANEDEDGNEQVTTIPQHALMELKHQCIQPFNRWSRRLLVYERRGDGILEDGIEYTVSRPSDMLVAGTTADELNPFRKRYFQAFEPKS